MTSIKVETDKWEGHEHFWLKNLQRHTIEDTLARLVYKLKHDNVDGLEFHLGWKDDLSVVVDFTRLLLERHHKRIVLRYRRSYDGPRLFIVYIRYSKGDLAHYKNQWMVLCFLPPPVLLMVVQEDFPRCTGLVDPVTEVIRKAKGLLVGTTEEKIDFIFQ